MKRISETVVTYGCAVFLVLILGLNIWWEWELWEECRTTNSYWYCIRVLAK